MKPFHHLARTLAFLCCAQGLPGVAADWPQWRGPNGLGVSSETELPSTWSAASNILWKVKPPGWADSSPIVVGERIYLTSQTDDTALHVIAIDRDSGKQLWAREVGRGKLKSHELHNMATPTPASDGRHVWALFGTGDLVCLDREGKVQWQRNLQKDYGDYQVLWGMGTSPILHDGAVFISCLHSGAPYLAALDATTGKERWKVTRDHGATREARDSYSSPIVVERGGSAQIVVAGGNHVDAYDPRTGKRLWLLGGLDVPHPYGRTIAGPAAGDGIVVAVASGFRNQGFVIGLKGSSSDAGEGRRLWTSDRFSPDCPTPVVYQGLVYFIRDDGIASCVDAQTGKAHWQERLFTENVKVSPVVGAGKVYFTSGRANCKVVKAGPRLEVVGENQIDEETLSTPALSGGQVFIRTKEHLYAVGDGRK